MIRHPGKHLEWKSFFPESNQIAASFVVEHPNYPPHDHKFVEMVFVVAGSCMQETALGKSQVNRGNISLFRPGAWHAYTEARHLEIYLCCFNPGILGRELSWMIDDPLLGRLLWKIPLSADQQGTNLLALPEAELKRCQKLLKELCALSVSQKSRRQIDLLGRLVLLLGILARNLPVENLPGKPSPPNPAISAALKLIDDNPAHDWTLAELAMRTHAPPNYLVRLFRKVAGLPPMAYLRRRRLELATRLLIHSDRPVSEVGDMVGWPDANYFTRRFRAEFGITPTAYRVRHAQVLDALNKNASQRSRSAI
ncbi:MAG TPA: AraC family transcriptional regulator [Verrucomicrobiae bacterium]|nr:AraC family transcriptional regulator [Verrucomicrobiae bacterium]